MRRCCHFSRAMFRTKYSKYAFVLLLLFCIVSFLSSLYFFSCGELVVQSFISCARSSGLKQAEQVNLRRTVQALDDLLNACNITYFIGGGTLLGFARNRRMIPFDDDVDLLINRESLPAIVEAFQAVHQNASARFTNTDVPLLRFVETPTILKAFLDLPNCHFPPGTTWCFPFVDMILYVEVGIQFVPISGQFVRIEEYLEVARGRQFLESDVFPRQREKLEGMNIWLPHRWEPFIDHSRVMCKTGSYSHRYEASVNCERAIPCHCLDDRWDEMLVV